LREVPEFAQRWTAMGLERYALHHVGGAYDFDTVRVGRYRVFPIKVTCPPVYHLREYVPTDDAAREHINSERRSGPASVSVSQERHWSLDSL
jgi:hypothetical protein